MEYLTQYRTLDLTLLDAVVKSLSYDSSAYAVVSICRSGSNRTFYKHRTAVAKVGSLWKHPVKVKLNIVESLTQKNQLTLVVKIKSVGLIWDETIGTARVPIKGLLDRATKVKQANPLYAFYDVIRYPKIEGSLSFTYKFGDIVQPLLPAVGGG